jgi:hypothetical protein
MATEIGSRSSPWRSPLRNRVRPHRERCSIGRRRSLKLRWQRREMPTFFFQPCPLRPARVGKSEGGRSLLRYYVRVDYQKLGPFLVAALVVFVVYRRLRRSFGRQVLSPKRMGIRITLLAVIGCAASVVAFRSTSFLGAMLAGIAAGAALGVWGANRTRFENFRGVLNYVPHTYTGIAVSLLFLGRLAYRLVELYGHGQAAHDAGFPVKRPFTLGMLYVLVGYYVCYLSLVLWKSKHLKPEDMEDVSTAVPS